MKKVLGIGFLCAVFIFLLGILFNVIFGFLFPEFAAIYADEGIFRNVNTAASGLFWFYPLVLGISLAVVWNKIKKVFEKDSVFVSGLKFGIVYFFVSALPTFFVNVGSFNLPVMMVFSWMIISFGNGVVCGWTFALLDK